MRFVFALSYIAEVGVLRTPTNRTAAAPCVLRGSVPPCKSFFFVIFVIFAVEIR